MIRSYFRPGLLDPACGGIAAFEITPATGPKRVFVVAMRGPVPGGLEVPDPFEWMSNGMGMAEEAFPATSNAWQGQPYALPPGNARISTPTGDEFVAAPVRGEIVRDSGGRLFEAAGQRLRPLQRLVRSPDGEVFELIPAPPRSASSPTEVLEGEIVEDHEPRPARSEAQTTRPAATPPTQTSPPRAPTCRMVFAHPGLPRVVRLGDFKSMLAPQLTHPERLREIHRLRCFVQVFESTREQRVDALFEAIQREAKSAGTIQPLTETAIAQLGLTGYLARRPRAPQHLQREPGFVLPFDRFFRLTLCADPTAETSPHREPVPTVPNPQTEAAVGPTGAAAPAATPEQRGKKEIPERFQKPWEFQLGRDEVLYDIHVGGSRGLFSTLRRKLGRWLRGREELHKWQALLFGKGLEEQLWAVRPPRGSLSDPAVREWASRTLEAADYDARAMLLEWEIFWRRKGV